MTIPSNLLPEVYTYSFEMRNFLKGANCERFKWLAVMLLGISVIVSNAHLKSLSPGMLGSAIEFIYDLKEWKLS